MDLIKKYLVEDIDFLLDCIDEAILIVDGKGNILKCNTAFTRIAQVGNRSLIGENLYDIVRSGFLKESAALKSLEVKKKMDMNLTYVTGQTATWTYIPVFNEAGELVLSIGTGRDITRLVDLEKKLKQSEMVISEYTDKIQRLEESFGLGNIIFSSEKMKNVMRVASRAAASDSPVLIWGETGVGKEMVARYIHQSSGRSKKPFIAINCASIPEELLESELFGYEEGSFTGAKRSGKKGLLEESHEGTLFLDEIGELPLKMQSKLLRFLQEGQIRKIGDNKALNVDVRILSATNLSMEQLTNSRQFRQDLFYRISVVPIHVPPLRDRKEDIAPLIYHFAKQFNEKYSANMQIPFRHMRLLHDYEWPGNIRELKNVIERIAILCASQEPTDQDFDLLLHLKPHDREINGETAESSLKSAMGELEENMIRQAYKETGSVVQAAKKLGINPATIHRKIKKGTLRLA